MSTAVKRVSLEEYRAAEEVREIKHEYFDGAEYPMTDGTYDHARLATRLIRLLANALADSTCEVLPSDLRIACPSGLLTYPDLSAVCGEPEFTEGRTDEVCNPVLLVEVLSPATAAFDRGEKFEHYQSIPSLKEYLLVAQDRKQIERFVRLDDGRWESERFTSGEVALTSLECSLPVDAVYERISLEKPAGGSERPAAAD